MPIPLIVFQRRASEICFVAEVWRQAPDHFVVHQAANALLHRWGIRINEHVFLAQGLIPVFEDANESPAAMC